MDQRSQIILHLCEFALDLNVGCAQFIGEQGLHRTL